MKLITVFEYNDLFRLQPMIIVENWRTVMSCGSKRRKYRETFNEDEMGIIFNQYNTFRKLGYLPKEHKMTIKEYKLTKKAVHFFATV